MVKFLNTGPLQEALKFIDADNISTYEEFKRAEGILMGVLTTLIAIEGSLPEALDVIRYLMPAKIDRRILHPTIRKAFENEHIIDLV